MTDKSLKTYVGEDNLPVQDLTAYVNWPESRFQMQAYNGQSSVSSIRFRDEAGEMGPNINTPIVIAARNEVEVKHGSNFLFRGRFIGRTWERGVQKAFKAREVVAEAEDVNVELRGLIVDQWVRPEELDTVRVAALGADYLDGSVRTGANLNVSTWVSASNTQTLPAKTYKQTDPLGVMNDIAFLTDKQFFVTIDKELWYDGYDSTNYACPFFITDNEAELRASPTHALSIIPDSGPMFAINGQEFIHKVRVYYGSGDSDYVEASTGSIYRDFKAYWEETVYAPDGVDNAAEAQAYADTVVQQRSQDGRTLTLSVGNANGGPLTEAQIGSIKPGMRIGIKSRVVPEPPTYAFYYHRIVTLQWHMPLPGQYFATLKLERPEKSYGNGNKALTTAIDLCRDEVSACIDPFTRLVFSDWGASPILCLDWHASSDGTHSVDGAIGYQAPTGGGEIPTDWLDLTAWTGGSLDFKLKLKGNGTGKGIVIYPWDGGALGPEGPVFDPFLSCDFRWTWGFTGGDLYTAVAAENNGIVASTSGQLAIAGAEDDWFWARCQLSGTNIRMRTWLDGDAEPGTWQSTATQGAASFLDADGLQRTDVFGLRTLTGGTGETFIDSLEFTSGVTCDGVACTRCITGGPDRTSGTSDDAAPADHDHDSVDNGDPAGGELGGTYPNPTVDATHAGSNHLQPVRKNSTGTVFERRRLNLIEGSNVTLTVADDSGNDEVDITVASTAAASLTVEESDANPSVSDVTVIVFDSADFLVTDDTGGQVTVESTGTGGGTTIAGYQRYAYALGGGPTNTATTALSLPANGGSVGIPVVLVAPMMINSLTIRSTDTASARAAEWRMYKQTVEPGQSGDEVVDEIAGVNGSFSFTPGAASNRSSTLGTAVLVEPGAYFIVLRNTHATNTFGLGTQAAGTMALNTNLIQTLGSSLGSTLDIINGWTHNTALAGIRLDDPFTLL